MQLFPIFVVVLPIDPIVPRWIVQYSLIILQLPISTNVSSPLYFKSCGFSPIIAPEKISQSFPILVPDLINTLECIFEFFPIFTLSSIIEYAPTLIFESKNASLLIIDVLCILLILVAPIDDWS